MVPGAGHNRAIIQSEFKQVKDAVVVSPRLDARHPVEGARVGVDLRLVPAIDRGEALQKRSARMHGGVSSSRAPCAPVSQVRARLMPRSVARGSRGNTADLAGRCAPAPDEVGAW